MGADEIPVRVIADDGRGCPSQSRVDTILVDVFQFLSSEYDVHPLGVIRSYPAESCDQLAIASPGSPPGLYWVGSSPQDATLTRCEIL